MTDILSTIKITGEIIEGMSDIQYLCSFTNNFDHPINPIHYISFDQNATVTDLKMKIGDRMLESVVSEKKIAENAFDTAVSSGISASIFKQLSDTEYKLTVGNVIPGETVEIIICYISHLDVDSHGQYKFLTPTNIALKYSSSTSNDSEYLNEVSDMRYSSESPISYSINIKWTSSFPFTHVTSNSPCIISHIDDKTMSITSTTNASQHDHCIFAKTSYSPSAYYYSDERNAWMLTNLRVKNNPSDDVFKNFNIIVDCSYSMSESFKSGNKTDAAVNAVMLFLAKLKTGDYFNITLFGSTHKTLFSRSILANPDRIRMITSKLSRIINYYMGGTELHDCMEESILDFSVKFDFESVDLPCDDSIEKVLILLTDGQVCNKSKILEMINRKMEFLDEMYKKYPERFTTCNFRIFGVGIGNNVDRNLVKEVSTACNGDFFCVSDSRNLNDKIDHIMSVIRGGFYKRAYIEENPDNEKGLNEFDTLYANKNYIFAMKVPLDILQRYLSDGIPIKCTSSKTGNLISCRVKPDQINISNERVKLLYYHMIIDKLSKRLDFDNLSWSERDEITQKIIQLSVDHNIMSKYTAFLIVDSKARNTDMSFDVTISQFHHSPECESVDALDGGMDMFSSICGGTVYNTKISYNSLVKREDGLFSAAYEDICYTSISNIQKDMKLVKVNDMLLFINIVIYMKFRLSHVDDSSQLLTSILNVYHGPAIMFLRVETVYSRYIKKLTDMNPSNLCDY